MSCVLIFATLVMEIGEDVDLMLKICVRMGD